ncbi:MULTISPECIES: patatin-like phospholipase family protein [unclassified Rhizobacter]|uniref:patatin-like phospholipase family protein n=1 Tax=unclassified Rhizobacter TaxID=2640088 RepID=UPI0006F28866|nr:MULTISPECIES: patatin-like phospholipase family protein [unclassified Rhizobacter]KQU81659.1 esterase [Rhizobacter sp. Root29]KQW01654.1 esterase [Rhizobacter sp. Root1238]KRB18519.1 esterase [Rhizobacter sp. Root16D2]
MRSFLTSSWARAAAVAAVVLLAGCQTVPVPSPSGSASSPAGNPPLVVVVPPDSAASAPPVVIIKPVPKPPRIGLALGGGAARGFAHIGVIQVLEENGIKPDLVVGTSAGSLVAALYASGKNGLALAAMADSMDESAITDWAFPGRGLIRGEALARFVRESTGGKTIEQMRLPLGIVATDLDNGAPVLFQRGDAGIAVRASSAVPAVFQPVRIGTREYVDGGLVSPVPVRFARQMGADLVIAVDISAVPDGAATGDPMRMLLQTFAIMSRSINAFELREADVVLRPKLNDVSSADFAARKRSIQAGREIALAMLSELKLRIAAKTH